MIKDYLCLKDGIELTYGYNAVLTKKSLPKISKFDQTATATLYISADADVPRVKLREFLKDTDMKITTSIEKADIVVVKSPESFMETFTDEELSGYIFKTEDLKEFMLKEYPESDLTKELENYQYPSVHCTYHFVNNNNLRMTLDFSCEMLKATYNPSLLETVIKTKTFCLAEDLLTVIGDSCSELTYNQYIQLRKMLSTDHDNIVLAMEIMANCNYRKSVHYLSALFMDYYHVMDTFPSKRHVNFKSLLTFMGLNPSSMYMHMEKSISLLHKNEMLNLETLDFLRDEFLLDVYTGHRLVNGSGNLVTLTASYDTPEILEVLGKPYVFNIPQDDRED
jgi:hypothetical protein